MRWRHEATARSNILMVSLLCTMGARAVLDYKRDLVSFLCESRRDP